MTMSGNSKLEQLKGEMEALEYQKEHNEMRIQNGKSLVLQQKQQIKQNEMIMQEELNSLIRQSQMQDITSREETKIAIEKMENTQQKTNKELAKLSKQIDATRLLESHWNDKEKKLIEMYEEKEKWLREDYEALENELKNKEHNSTSKLEKIENDISLLENEKKALEGEIKAFNSKKIKTSIVTIICASIAAIILGIFSIMPAPDTSKEQERLKAQIDYIEQAKTNLYMFTANIQLYYEDGSKTSTSILLGDHHPTKNNYFIFLSSDDSWVNISYEKETYKFKKKDLVNTQNIKFYIEDGEIVD